MLYDIYTAALCLAGTAVLGLVAGAVTVVLARRRSGDRPPDPSAAAPNPSSAQQTRRHAGTITALAWVWLLAGGAAAAWASRPYADWWWKVMTDPDAELTVPSPAMFIARAVDGSLILLLTPLVVGAGFLVVHGIGERTWPRPSGTTRRAVLAPRSARAMAGRALPAWCMTLSGTTVAVLFAGAVAQDPRAPLGIIVRCDDESYQRAGGWLGTYYGVPLVVHLVVLGILTVLVLRAIARRPAVADDLTLRQASTRQVLTGVQLVVGVTLAGVLVKMGTGLRSAHHGAYLCGEVPTDNTQLVLGTAAIGLAVAVVLACVAVVVWNLRTTIRGDRARQDEIPTTVSVTR